MKIEDLIRTCAAAPPNCEEEFEPEEEGEEDEVSTLVAQLEDAWFLLDAINDHLKNPKARMTTYFKREITRISGDIANTLFDYNIS